MEEGAYGRGKGEGRKAKGCEGKREGSRGEERGGEEGEESREVNKVVKER